MDDEEHWNSQPDEHKWASKTGSFSYVRDPDNKVIDMTSFSTMPVANETFYLTNSWHRHADIAEVHEDIKDKTRWEKQALLAAVYQPAYSQFLSLPTPKAAKRPRRKVNAARREANANEKRMYAKQFKEAKFLEWQSWSKENDVLELVDMRKEKIQKLHNW